MSAAARKGAVRAVDLVPAAFAEEEEDAGAGTLEFDLGHMVAFDAATVTGKQLGQHGPVREAALRKEAASRAQALVAQLWQLPVRKTDVGPMVRAHAHALVRHRTTTHSLALVPLQRCVCGWSLPTYKLACREQRYAAHVCTHAYSHSWKLVETACRPRCPRRLHGCPAPSHCQHPRP